MTHSNLHRARVKEQSKLNFWMDSDFCSNRDTERVEMGGVCVHGVTNKQRKAVGSISLDSRSLHWLLRTESIFKLLSIKLQHIIGLAELVLGIISSYHLLTQGQKSAAVPASHNSLLLIMLQENVALVH